MKKKILGCMLAALMLLTSGCQSRKPVVYSNLTEDAIRYDLDSLLENAGVSDQQRFVFFSHVDQFNEAMNQEFLTQGFSPLGSIPYDSYAVQDAWDQTHPDFMGYNCRITAFTLYTGHFLKMPENPEILSEDMLIFDLAALEQDSSAFPAGVDRFRSFFSSVPTENTKDQKVHVSKILESWENRGITFVDDPDIRMINMVFHAQDGEENYLFIGHSGVLLPTPDGELWFLEKLAFQQPYQLVVFQNRKQLEDYLMEKYDLDQGQPLAKPFILENDSLMKS